VVFHLFIHPVKISSVIVSFDLFRKKQRFDRYILIRCFPVSRMSGPVYIAGHLQVIIGIAHGKFSQRCGIPIIGIESDYRFPLVPLFGGDEDDPAGPS